jgi:hypothetical protein
LSTTTFAKTQRFGSYIITKLLCQSSSPGLNGGGMVIFKISAVADWLQSPCAGVLFLGARCCRCSHLPALALLPLLLPPRRAPSPPCLADPAAPLSPRHYPNHLAHRSAPLCSTSSSHQCRHPSSGKAQKRIATVVLLAEALPSTGSPWPTSLGALSPTLSCISVLL